MASNDTKKPVATSLHDKGSNNVTNQGDNASRLYPDLDADSDYVHFEMTPEEGDSLLWLTLRRGIIPQRAAMSLRKIADLIDQHGLGILEVLEGQVEPVRLAYNEGGNIVIAEK